MEEIDQYFNQVYDQYVNKIYRFIYLKVSLVETAEDLSSEVFLRLYKHIQKNNPVIENPQAFVYQIARNVIADHYRSKKITVVSIEKTTIEIEDIQERTREQGEVSLEMDRIKEAIAKLQGDYQDLIIWRYVDELTVPEIAQITGKTEENVRVGVHRAIQALKGKVDV
jgi:RNA polymerase sigma-70 factor (ECF subfamily)